MLARAAAGPRDERERLFRERAMVCGQHREHAEVILPVKRLVSGGIAMRGPVFRHFPALPQEGWGFRAADQECRGDMPPCTRNMGEHCLAWERSRRRRSFSVVGTSGVRSYMPLMATTPASVAVAGLRVFHASASSMARCAPAEWPARMMGRFRCVAGKAWTTANGTAWMLAVRSRTEMSGHRRYPARATLKPALAHAPAMKRNCDLSRDCQYPP